MFSTPNKHPFHKQQATTASRSKYDPQIQVISFESENFSYKEKACLLLEQLTNQKIKTQSLTIQLQKVNRQCVKLQKQMENLIQNPQNLRKIEGNTSSCLYKIIANKSYLMAMENNMQVKDLLGEKQKLETEVIKKEINQIYANIRLNSYLNKQTKNQRSVHEAEMLRELLENIKTKNDRLIQQNEQLNKKYQILEKENSIITIKLQESEEQQQKLRLQIISLSENKFQKLQSAQGQNKNQDQLNCDFSFGKQQNSPSKQKIEQQLDMQMDLQCYKASVEGLLQQNKKLKSYLQILFKMKQGEQIPQEIEKQINIMRSILQLSQNP